MISFIHLVHFRTRGGLEITPVDDDKKEKDGGSFLDKLGFQKRKVKSKFERLLDLNIFFFAAH